MKSFVILSVVLGLVGTSPTKTDQRTTSVNGTFFKGSTLSTGYPFEVHRVTTKDGYILDLHRIPHGIGQDPSIRRPAVFLMHGLTGISDAYVVLGTELSLAYNLVNAGFDVWLGNARGNGRSRQHVTLNPDDRTERFQFFDFTWEEIGMIDVPAMIDYILEYTGRSQLHYIGHSQGGTTFLVMCSTLPEYNDKIATAHLLAGVGYKTHFPDPILRGMAMITNSLYSLALRLGFVEIGSLDDLPFTRSQTEACSDPSNTSDVCTLMQFAKYTRDSSYVELGDLRFGRAATKQYAHYGQNIRDDEFRRWDYGAEENLAIYGEEYPPIFNLSLITTKTIMHYTVSDNLLDERDVIAMAQAMPDALVRRVARDTFSHVDFVIAQDAKAMVNDYIVESLTLHTLANEAFYSSSSIFSSSPFLICALVLRILFNNY